MGKLIRSQWTRKFDAVDRKFGVWYYDRPRKFGVWYYDNGGPSWRKQSRWLHDQLIKKGLIPKSSWKAIMSEWRMVLRMVLDQDQDAPHDWERTQYPLLREIAYWYYKQYAK